MKYRSIIGTIGTVAIRFSMECSSCGKNLRSYYDEIFNHKLKYCPNCGRKLTQREQNISEDVIVEMLNNQTTVDEGGRA